MIMNKLINLSIFGRFHSLLILLFFIFSICFLNACKKDEALIPDRIITGVINQQSFSWEDGESGITNHAGFGFGNDCSATGIIVYQQSAFISQNTDEQLNIGFSACVDLSGDEEAQSLGMLKTGNISYGNILIDKDVVQIMFTDSIGSVWASYLNNGNQDGGNFEILKVQPSGMSSAIYNIEGTFNCKLYRSTGEFIELNVSHFAFLAGITPSF
jgi:hypothetical protein